MKEMPTKITAKALTIAIILSRLNDQVRRGSHVNIVRMLYIIMTQIALRHRDLSKEVAESIEIRNNLTKQIINSTKRPKTAQLEDQPGAAVRSIWIVTIYV